MIRNFFIILGGIVLFVVIQNLISFLITKKFELSKQKALLTVVEVLVATIFISFEMWTIENNKDIAIFLAPLFLAVIPTYNFTIAPLKHLLFHKKTKISAEIEQKLAERGFKYKVRVTQLEKSSAFATGILPFYKLIFIDKKILESLPKEQVLSVIYHEVGHHEKHHLLKMLSANILLLIVFFYIFRLIVENPYYAPLFIFIYFPIMILATLRIQHKYEYQADSFSAKINSKKNIVEALQNLDPIFNGRISKGGITHPTLAKRIRHINNEE